MARISSIGQLLDLVDLMRGAEAIEEVQEGHARFKRGGLGDQRHILRFLNRARSQQRKTGRADGHHIRVIAKDRERVCSQRAG